MATEADVPEAISVMKGEGEDRYLISEQFDRNVEHCPPVELTKPRGEPIQHPEMEKPCAVSENVQVESSVLVDSKHNGFGISEGEHFLEPLSDIPHVDQSNQAGLMMEKTQDANLEVGRVELASNYETYGYEHVQVISNEEDSNKENIPCLEKDAECSQKYVEGEEMVDEHAGLYRILEATTFQDYEAPISNLDLTNDSFKKDTELETNVHKTLDTDPILQEETCLKITSNIGEDSEQTVQKIELEEEPQNLPEVKPEDAKRESACETEEVIASTEEEIAVQTTQEYLEKNEPDLVHSTKENGNISEVFKATTEEQETEEHALPEIQNAEEETHIPSFKEEEKKGDAKCEELIEVTDTTKETESETVEQRIETSRDLDVPIPEEEAYAAESTKACDQNDSSISEDYEVKTKETIQEDHSAVSGYDLVSEEVGAEAESKELVENNPEEKDLETILLDETAVEVEDQGQAEDVLNSKEIIEKEIQTPKDEVEKDLKATAEETNKPVEDTGVACEEKDPAVVLADHPTLKTEEVEVQAKASVDSNDVLERQMPAAADESDDGSMEVQAENYELVTNTDITSEEKGLESIVTNEGETCEKEAEEKNEEPVKIKDSSHEEKTLPIIPADGTLEVELRAEENVILKENLERQIPTTADEGVTCLKEPNEMTILRDETADITPEEKCLASISLDEKVPEIEADEGDKGLKEAEEENKEQITSRDISSEDKALPTILTDEMAAENEDVEIQADENVDSKESLEEENPAATEIGDTCVKEADEEKAPATILTDDIAEAIDYAGVQETENNLKEILEEQIPSVPYRGETDLKEAESEIKEQVETTDIAPIHKDIEYIDEQGREISSKEAMDEQIPTTVDEGALDLKEAEAEIKEEEATDYAPDQKSAETINISRDETTLDLEDVQEQENSTSEKNSESQTPTEAEAETCMKEGEAENMEQFTSAGIAAEDKGLSTILSDEPAKDIEDIQAEEKQFPKEAGEGEEKASHGNINVDDTSVKVYSTEVEAAGLELGVEDEKLEVHPEKNHTVGEEVFDEPKITTRDFSEEQSIEGNATVITPESVGEDTIKNHQDDEKETESIKEEIASEISREYISEDATAQFKDDKCDEILEDSQTVVVDERKTTCETTNVEKSEEQFSTLPVKSEESPLVLEKYEPAEEGITKLPEQTKPESSVEDAEVLSYTKEEMQESLDTSVGEACIEEAELSAEAEKENIDDHKTEEVSSSLKGVAESSTEQENFETSLQEVEKTKDQEECKDTIEGTREAKFQTSEDTTEVVEATHIAALENKDNEATDVQEDEYFNSNDNFERQIPTVADEEVEQKLEVEDLPEKNNKICEEVVDEPNIIGRDLTVTEEIATNPTDKEAVKDDDDDEKVTEKFNEEERSTQNITEGHVKDSSPEYVLEDSKEKYTDCLEEAFETKGEACNEVAELSTEAEKEETVEESSKEEEKEGHEVCEEATEAKSDILEDTTEPKPILEEESKKSLDGDYSSSAQESEKERGKEIEGEYTSTVRNIDSEVVGGETGLKEANAKNEDLVESSHIASEEKENEGTGVYDMELASATTVEASFQAETVEEEAEPKLEVANEREKSDDQPEKNNICEEVLDEPKITLRDLHEEKLTQGSVVNFATESSVEEMITNCQVDENETEKVNNEGSSIENTKEGDDGIISTEYAPEDSGEKLKECTQEEVESKEEILHESQTYAPEEKIIGSSEVVPESVPESIDEISQDEITAEQTSDEVISKEPSTLLSEEKELTDSEHEHKNIEEEQAKDGNVPTEEYTRVEETLLKKEESRELTYSEMAVEKLVDGETEEPIKETCETVPVSEPQSIGLVSEDEIITDQTHCDGNKEPNSSESVAADTPEEEIKDDSAVMTIDSESTSEVSKEEIITQVPVFAKEQETQSVDKNIEEEEVPKEAQVPDDEEKLEVISKEPSTLLLEEKELVDSEPEHKDIEEEQVKDVDVPTEKDTGVEETLLPKEETRELTFIDMANDKLDAGETEEPTENTSESVLVAEPRSIGLVSENEIITDQTRCDGENEPKGSESVQETVDADTIEEDVKDESAEITKCDSESTDDVSKEENIADQTLQEVVTMEQVSAEDKELKAAEDEHDTTSVDKNIEEEEVPKEAQVPADEEKPEEKCLQIEEPKDSDLAEQNSDAAETEEEIKRTVETVTEPEPESIIVASGDETVADQKVCEGITDTTLSTARDLDTSELAMEKSDAEHIEEEIKHGPEMVSKSDSGSIELVSSDEIIVETKEQIQSPSSAFLSEEKECKASEPDGEAQDTNVQECIKEVEVSADEHNQASLAANSVEEKCLPKEEMSEEITADETLSKEVIDTPLETPPYTSLHEERELEACELDSEKLVADVPEEETKEGSDVIPRLDSQSSHKVSTESIEEAAEVTSISQESPEATEILDQGEEHTQVETSEVADQIEVREFQLPEEIKASDNVGLEKLDSDAPEEEIIRGSELVPESDCKTIDVAALDEVIDEQTLDEGITNEQLQIPSSTLLSEEKELRVSEHEATTADKNIEEEQAAEVYVPTEEDTSVEETLFPKEGPRELKVSELALEKLDASETEEETKETSETFLVSEPQSIGAVPDDEIITDETQCDGEKELKASHETLDAYTTDEQEVKDDSALVPKCDSVSTDDVLKDEIIAEQTVKEDISREQLQIPSSALLADETMLEASEHEHETTCVDKSIDEVPKEVDVSFDEDKAELIVVAPEKETCLQTEEAKDSEPTLEKLKAGKTEDETKETFDPVTQLESESIAVASGEETAGDLNVCEGVVVNTPLSIAREFDTSELHMEKPSTEEDIKEGPETVSNIDSGSIKVVSSDEIIAETKEQIQSPSSTLLPEEKEREASEPEDETTPQDMNTQDCIKEVDVSPDEDLQKEEMSEVNVSELAPETVSKSDFPSAVAVPSEETTADETLTKEVTDIPLQIPSYTLLHEERELKASELNSEKQDAYIPDEEVKDEIVVDELQTPSSAFVPDEKKLKASEYEYETMTNDKNEENENLKELEEPTDKATQDLYGGRSADLQKVIPSEFEVTKVEGQTEGVKETFETVSKDDITADHTHCDEIKEDSTELALEKQDTDATEEVKEVSEVTPRTDLQSVPAKDEFIADQVLHIPSPALLSEENEHKESDHEYGTAIQYKATEKEPAEEIQVTDVEDTEEPRWHKLSELLAEHINAGEIEEQTKEASETAPEVSSRSIGELSTEEIADQIPPASLLTEEKSYENTTTTDNAEEKSMNVVEGISVPNEETRELNVFDLEFHSSQDTQKIISTEVHAASNEEKILEVATSDSRAEDCATTTEANEAAKIKISNEEIKDEEELPKDSQLISVDQENIKERQEESEPRDERYAEERKEQFNTAPSFKDYEVPEVKLDDTASKYHSPDEAEGIKPSNDTLDATEAIEEKSSKSGVESTDSKFAPASLSECLMDETTKESKEVVTHLTEEKEHADEEEDDQEHVEEAKTDEEKEDTEHNGTSHSYDEPVIVEASRDSGEVKVSPKKSHNILSGMGSKVKHSISKVKKAIIGKSSNSKTLSDK